MEEKKKKLNDTSEDNELELIESLEQAIRDNLNTLKTDIKSSLNQSDDSKDLTQNSKEKKGAKVRVKKSNSFINYFGNLPTLSPRVLNKFDINIPNFKNSITNFLENLSLESFYYYISIYKIIGEDFNLDLEKILTILEDHINSGMFVSSETEVPDVKSIFLGLSILSEFDYYKSSELIDFDKIEDFLRFELERIKPEKLHINYYALNSVNVLNRKFFRIELDSDEIFNKIRDFDISSLENFDPTIDYYEFFSCIQILDSEEILNDMKNNYEDLIINTFDNLELQKLSITGTARILLTIDLLNLKNDKNQLVKRLLDKLMNSTRIFNSDIEDTDFSWNKDKIAWLLELRMLFWALLASFRFYSFIQ
ncbi:MAG: hypothetical protein ACQERB_03115 [Promethearchaeati archaeon]